MDVNVCLQGGGTRLASHLGALKGIEEQGGRVRGYAGASAGSLVAAVLAGGFTHDMAVDLMHDTNYRQFLDIRPLGLIRGYGLCSGRKFEQWLDRVLQGQKFADLQMPLSVICTNIQNGEPFVFSKQATPNIKVSTAVRCSIGIPGVFAVRRMRGAILIDGSLASHEDHVLFPDSPHETITIRLVRSQTGKLAQSKRFGLSTYVLRVAGMLLDAADEPSLSNEKWQRTLLIRTGKHSSVNFDLKTDERTELYEMGYEQCMQYLDLSGATIAKKTAAERATAKEYRNLEELAEDAVRLAREGARGNGQNMAEGLNTSLKTPTHENSRKPYPAGSGLGFEAL